MANPDLGELRRPDGGPVRVLVVDDEPTLAELLSMALRYEGWDVRSAGDGLSAVRTAREFRPDAVVVDMMLPDIDGLEVLRRLRGETPDVPVLFLTAKDSVEDRIAGLTAGGDDYVTKPFSLEEVVARLRGLMRRMGRSPLRTESQLTVGDLNLDEDSHEVRRGGDLINLTATEFELLRYLMRNPRRVLSKSQILDRVWNYDFGGQANVVELYISYLRKKIDAGRPPMIHTLRGAGYVLKRPRRPGPAVPPRAAGPTPRSAGPARRRAGGHRHGPDLRFRCVGRDRPGAGNHDRDRPELRARVSGGRRPARADPGGPAAGEPRPGRPR